MNIVLERVQGNFAFKTLLINYYEGKDEKKIRAFLKKECYMSI